MSRINVTTLKSKFETGDRPTGQDYVDLIDTLSTSNSDLGAFGNNENTITGIENETVIDSFEASTWRMVKYLISISKTTSGDNKFYATEMTILIDGTDVSVSEYGMIDNDGDVGTIEVSRDGNIIQLIVTPNPTIKPVTVRFARIGLKA